MVWLVLPETCEDSLQMPNVWLWPGNTREEILQSSPAIYHQYPASISNLEYVWVWEKDEIIQSMYQHVSTIKQLWNYDTVVSSPVASCENQKAYISFGLADCCDSRRHIRELPRCSKVTHCRQICVGHRNSFMLKQKPDVQRWKPKGQRSSHLVNDCHFNYKFINSTYDQSNRKSAFWC